MTRLASLPLTTLRLIQRTFAAGLRAVSWLSLRENCGRMLTQVYSLHFLVHFISPKRSYRQIRIGELLELCGFHRLASLEDAMRALQRLLKDYPQWAASSPPTGSNPTSEVCANDISALRVIPSKFWTLCQQILAFRQQRPTNLPVSKGISIAGTLMPAPMHTNLESYDLFFVRRLSFYRKLNGQRCNCNTFPMHGRTFELPLPLLSKIRTRKQELQYSSQQDGNSVVTKYLSNIMRWQPA